MSFPFWWSILRCVSKWVGSRREFVINKIIIIKFLNASSVTFKWSDNISNWMIWWVLIGKIKILSNFFTFSNVYRSVKYDSSNFNFLLSSNLRFLMFFRLLDLFFLNYWFRWRLWFFINFTDKINTTYRWSLSEWFFCLNLCFIIFNFRFVINFRFRFWLLFGFLIDWSIERFVRLWRW